MRKENLMVFPKPEWIRYQVQLDRKPNGAYLYPSIHMYIYAHGEQMVREILDDYLVTKIERMDKE